MCYFEWYTWRFIKLAVQLYPGRKTLPFWKLFLTNFKTICDLSCENVPYSLPFLHGKPFVYGALAVWTDWAFVQTAQAVFVKKKLASVQTAQAIRAKKICIDLNGSCYPCKRICHLFEQLGLSVQKNCHPFEKNCWLFERLELSVQR